MRNLFVFLLALTLAAPLLLAQANQPNTNSGVDARRKQLDDLLKEQWEYTLRTSPEFASILGDKRYNDKLSDFSQKAIEADLRQSKIFLDKFNAVDATGFPEQEQLNQRLMVRDLSRGLQNAHFKNWEMPVNQFFGIHLDAPQLVQLLPFDTVKDYDDYIARLKQMPRALDETSIQMRNGMRDKLMPPQFLLVKVADQADRIAKQTPEESPFAMPLKKFPATFPEADKQRLTAGVLAAIKEAVLPAYVKFAAFVRNDYAPHGRQQEGLWSLPDGDARYRAAIGNLTTTNMAPADVHQLGLNEVARIEGEMLKIANQMGFQELKSFNAALEKDPKLRPASREDILNYYRKYTGQMYEKLPQLFGRLPKAKVVVMPVEEFREKEASGAAYNQGTPDGSRPGHIMVNTGAFKDRKIISFESTAYHEGVPGHHMQISIAQELPTLPPFRQQAGYTAYVEGWALYSERLGKEVGFYQDPYSDYGRLQDEMLRAIRLVVDSGVHYKHWTRQQVVDYFHAHSAQDEPDIQSETDRYIAWPAQALAYKIGQLKITELREKAKRELGGKFDIRAYHDEVLGAGALPMEVLEERINNWIAQQKK
ncbi:MAG: DUF885 domain-containing protein [Candidatus Koribacter versatilis]|uniref:DUF885 domain-containing protein n=1 Tax=Candidatus Korobacter versatilis TaxID=658062 RepID=A0A932EPP7_9BACT|nr:DUF885 domain-containing protein [Candidatus Koribacter versatilis]